MTISSNLKKILVQVIILSAVLAAALLLSHSRKKGPYVSIAGFTQGTTYHITYESRAGEDYKNAIDSLLADFDHSLSTYDPNSIISRFNRNDPTVVADEKFTDVFNKSHEVFLKTDGAFDITVKPIVDALGFGSGRKMEVDSAVIDSLRQYVGMEKVELKNGKVIKRLPQVTLDVNALAQGYSVDIAVEFLEHHKISNYMVEIGGEVRARGTNEHGEYWKIGIDKPVEGNLVPGEDLQTIIKLNDRALATSGNYRKFYEKNGIKYVHTINPKTGYPVISNLLSATVVAEDCITADAYATAFMVIGLDRAKQFLEKNRDMEGFLIYADEKGNFRVFYTAGLRKYIVE
jgi:FAD:protein FMN transferase